MDGTIRCAHYEGDPDSAAVSDSQFRSHAARRRMLSNLPRRAYLTYRYHGGVAFAYRAVTFPLRFTPLERYVRLSGIARDRTAAARRWYRRNRRPVTVVIPSYRDAELVERLVVAIRRTTDARFVQIIVSDDASGPEHLAALRGIEGIHIVESSTNGGFAQNVNRGLRAADPAHDVVLLNSDVVPFKGWLACLQYTTSYQRPIGVVAAKLLYPDGRIQYGGTIRNLGALEWFDHRYRFQPSDYGPSDVEGPTLAASGAAMYITREALDAVGLFDEQLPMAYEDVDFSLRVWEAGLDVFYQPAAQLRHDESTTRGTIVGERERTSQRVFWEKWAAFFDRRDVRTPDGKLRLVYVTEDTGVGGGHRDIFEHLNRLAERGHDVSLWTLASPPDWFQLRCPIRSFENYDKLVAALAPLDAIKIATWWNTSAAVWRSSVLHGIPVNFVQDIETSYYADSLAAQHVVLDSYRHEFRYMTISSWNRNRLRELGLDAELIPPGIDLETFRPIAEVERRTDMVLALGRTNPLKNLPLTLAAWRRLPEPRPELCLFGIEPDCAPNEPGVKYVTAPSDAEVNELFNRATVFVQTSVHEGFCLPPLESMATGGAVVCTDAHGNRDFCRDGENCLMPAATADAVAAAISRLLSDPAERHRLGEAGIETAAGYAWPRRIDALERFLENAASPLDLDYASDAVPDHVGPPRG
jgi:GT2 family glycosyltransferase